MYEFGMSQLVKYLVYDEDFVTIARSIFKDMMADLGTDSLYLMQSYPDSDTLKVIISEIADANAEFFPEGEDTSKKSLDQNNILAFPVVIRNEAAMYVCAFFGSKECSEEQKKALETITLIIQSIASRKNFEDSMENSLKLLGVILDEIPSGVAVLDRKEKNVLMLNRLGAESVAMQNAMGTALIKYIETGSRNLYEIYDTETGLWFDVQFTGLNWIDGREVLLCTVIDVTQKVKNQQRIEYQANNDYLTGLFNRMKCERDVKEVIEKAVCNKERGALIFLDLDDFKQVNDGLGHQYGDVLLQEIAGALSAIPEISNCCYRMGGDEFVIIIRPEYFQNISGIVDNISKRFGEPWMILGTEYYCTMSMGLAVFPDCGSHVHDVLKKADYAMYQAKKGGKNRYLWYSDEENDRSRRMNYVETAVKNAVSEDCGGLKLCFLPVVDVNNRLSAVKVSVSLSDPDSDIEPDEFSDAVENLGVAGIVGDYVLDESCKILSAWNSEYAENLKMLIPVYAVQLIAGNPVSKCLDTIKENRADSGNIFLNISETTVLRDVDKAVSTLDVLRVHGIGVALDDFGRGDMSLERISVYKASVVTVSDEFLKKNGALGTAVVKGMSDIKKEMGFLLCSDDKDSPCDLLIYPDRLLSRDEFEKEWLA